MNIRPGSVDDMDTIVGLFDEAIEWLVAQGRSDQWGDQPLSTKEGMLNWVRGLVEQGDLFIAETGDEPVGALIVNPVPMSYTPAIEEPELYVRLLIVSRRSKGQRIGSRLLDYARDEAARRGISLLRLDCYASEDEALIGYYESQGFTRTERIEVRPGVSVQVFEQRLTDGTCAIQGRT
jgi:ribosomal protein S18 acetylase RimI-like enzyme